MYAATQIQPLDDENVEEWLREIPPPAEEVHGVNATKSAGADEWAWRVMVYAMEFVREEPLESQLRGELIAALRAVPGVARAEEDDREAWIVDGEPDGRALIDAVGAVVDRHAAAIRSHIDAL